MPETSALVTALILERPLCLDCIADRTQLSIDAALTVLDILERPLDVHREDSSRCRSCGRMGVGFYIDRPVGPRPG